jgi:quinol monooxygenase YgiN
MSTTVIVVFRARPGRAPELVQWLQALHPRLRDFAGFESISIHQDEQAPDVVVELEHWQRSDDHRAMVASIASEGGWVPMSALLETAPETRYLRETP